MVNFPFKAAFSLCILKANLTKLSSAGLTGCVDYWRTHLKLTIYPGVLDGVLGVECPKSIFKRAIKSSPEAQVALVKVLITLKNCTKFSHIALDINYLNEGSSESSFSNFVNESQSRLHPHPRLTGMKDIWHGSRYGRSSLGHRWTPDLVTFTVSFRIHFLAELQSLW